MRIGDLLQGQSLEPAVIQPHQCVGEASRLIAQFGIGLVIVVDDQRNIVGVVSERDIAIGVGKSDVNLADMKVEDLMTKQVVTCNPDESVVDAVYVMNKKGFRHLILARDQKPIGVPSMRDVLRQIEPLLEESKSKGDEQKLMEFLEALKAA
jgi:CBS domain-containing protein